MSGPGYVAGNMKYSSALVDSCKYKDPRQENCSSQMTTERSEWLKDLE